MTVSTVPTPAIFANRKPAVAVKPIPAPPAPPALIAKIEPSDPGKVVTIGRVDELVETIHDGVVKTKHLKRGQRVRAFVKGEARGGERIIESVTKIDDGEFWHVEYASAHIAEDKKAAYRWFDESLVGTTVQHVVKVAGFVAKHDRKA